MSDRATGRHRAPGKSTSSSICTPTGSMSLMAERLSSVRMGSVRRSGVIIAMSSGLVASMALPAHAVTSGSAEVNGPTTASVPAGNILSAPVGLAVEDGTVSAPASATLDFDHTGFVAVPSDSASPSVDLGAPSGTGTTTDGDQTATSPSDSTAPAPTVTAPSSGIGAAAVALASRYIGTPYRFGGTTPSGFDCSGFVQYVFAHLGISLPRTAAEQADAVRHIPRSQARPGDLVLFAGGGHIAIYLGGNMMIDAPHTGSFVGIRQIYTSAVSFGRAA